jgi:hypothetical protein
MVPISHIPKTQATGKWEWTGDAQLAFRTLKKAFTEAQIIQQFNPQKPSILQSDSSGVAISSILPLYNGFQIISPVNLYTQKCSPGWQNYATDDWELLAIVKTMEQ